MTDLAKLMNARATLKSVQHDVEMAIHETPTGEVRNAICDANIHLVAAAYELKKALNKAYEVRIVQVQGS
jgi:hypothetical protein